MPLARAPLFSAISPQKMHSSEFAEVMQDWPQPGTGNDSPLLRYRGGSTILAYDTADEGVAVVMVPHCQQVICGHPNDEALNSHPLYGRGLAFYSVHRVTNSLRLRALEQANAIHPRHNAETYLKNREHWVFTFQNRTVELILLALGPDAISFRRCDSWAEANALIVASEV